MGQLERRPCLTILTSPRHHLTERHQDPEPKINSLPESGSFFLGWTRISLNSNKNPHSISLAGTPDPVSLENTEERERLEQRGHTTNEYLEVTWQTKFSRRNRPRQPHDDSGYISAGGGHFITRNKEIIGRSCNYGKRGADISQDIPIQQTFRPENNEVEMAEHFSIFESRI